MALCVRCIRRSVLTRLTSADRRRIPRFDSNTELQFWGAAWRWSTRGHGRRTSDRTVGLVLSGSSSTGGATLSVRVDGPGNKLSSAYRLQCPAAQPGRAATADSVRRSRRPRAWQVQRSPVTFAVTCHGFVDDIATQPAGGPHFLVPCHVTYHRLGPVRQPRARLGIKMEAFLKWLFARQADRRMCSPS